jgi:endonuclease YncB( thermonuclease family)
MPGTGYDRDAENVRLNLSLGQRRFGLIVFVLSVLAGMLLASWAKAETLAAQTQMTDADTLVLSGTKFRLDGIDAPERNQQCLMTDGKLWRCGEAAMTALARFIGDRPVTCQDVGADTKYNRRIGRCSVGEVNIEHWLVREGWAIEFKMHSDGRFADEESGARENRRGMWASCFANPRDVRYFNRSNATFMGQCPSDIEPVRNQLFGQGVWIKAKVFAMARQVMTGLRGIYHTEGCGSYGKMASEPDGHRLQLFASAAVAEEAGFRKAKNCLK